jgi:transketolase
VATEIQRGGYVLVEPASEPHAVIIATGSEVSLAVEAQKLLSQAGIAVRVVSMPSTNVFDRQDASYRDGVLPPLLPTVAVEAGVSGLWHKYVGRTGAVVGIDRFGESAPAGELFKLFGLTAERVAKTVRSLLA